MSNCRRFDDGQQLEIHLEPRSRYAYSGEGIDLPQLIVEMVKRVPLEVLMQK
jgi:CubicO group peptidase (beta-lactamase class C family)